MPSFLLALLLPAAAPPPKPPAAPFADHFRLQAKRLADASLADVRSREDWQKQAPERRRRFLGMMGLDPLPPRTNLRATITGTLDMDAFTVEKLHFQSMPGLYVTANLYLPKKRAGKLPGVLYVCGHGPAVIDGVAHGNKVTYQHHAAWFARNGYACLVVDTLQLGEVAGLHHGTSRFGMWWWPSLGYTPAGVELWNAIRALDYLESREEVDPQRLGVTGRSGGGATSWWVGAADERVKCIVPVAGIADLYSHVSEGYPGRLANGVVGGHCDCMYMVNTERWDYSDVIALCAPRPLMLGNSDKDDIFPVPGYRRMAGKIERLYSLLGASEKFALLETQGPHKDTPQLRDGAFRWMNRWLKNDKSDIADPEHPKIDPRRLKVFDRLPADAINDIVHERFRKPARHDLPESPEVARAWWAGRAPLLKQALLDRVFRGWPSPTLPLNAKLTADLTRDGVRVRTFDFVSEEAVPSRVWLVQAEGVEKPAEILANVVDADGWKEWVADLGPSFRDVMGGGVRKRDETRFHQMREVMRRNRWAYAIVSPRPMGDTQIRRRYLLLGQTLEGQQAWDVRRAVQCVRTVEKGAPLTLQAKGDACVLAVYAAIFEPSVAGVELWNPPASHRTGPALLNVLTVLDMPQAVALLPKATLHVRDEKDWAWLTRLQEATGERRATIRASSED